MAVVVLVPAFSSSHSPSVRPSAEAKDATATASHRCRCLMVPTCCTRGREEGDVVTRRRRRSSRKPPEESKCAGGCGSDQPSRNQSHHLCRVTFSKPVVAVAWMDKSVDQLEAEQGCLDGLRLPASTAKRNG